MEKILSNITKANEELDAFLTKIKEDNLKLLEAVISASNAYSADIKMREKKIKQQIEDLEERKQTISNTLENMRPHFVNATTAGDTDKIEELQKHMADLKAEEAAINTQIEFLYTTPITGNQELFDAATELNNKLKKTARTLELFTDR